MDFPPHGFSGRPRERPTKNGKTQTQSWFLSAAPAASPKIQNQWGPHGDPMGSHGSPYGSKLTFEKTDLDHFPARVFLNVQFSFCFAILFWKIFSKNMLVNYRGKIMKVSWRGPGQNGRF